MTTKGRTFGFQGRRDKAAEEAPPPPGLLARQAASAALGDILGKGRTLEERLAADHASTRINGLDARDQALARSIVVVSLRRLGLIRAALARFLDKGLPRKADGLEWILVAGAAQILFMDTPDHAAVDLAVHSVKRDPKCAPYASLSNAVLRNVIRARDELINPADDFIDLPPWLAARWKRVYGEAGAAAIARMHRNEPTLDVTVRDDAEGWAKKLDAFVLPTGSLRVLSHAPVADMAGFDQGQWWVQDAAAALPARLLRVTSGERAADLCAAPGGKTAQLAAAGARVTALDRSAERMKRLAANLERLGLDADLQIGDALAFEGGTYDAVLLDAPCSATGTIRRHPDVAWIKRPGDIAALAATQAKMLDRAAAMLAPGGRLVYSACSLEPEEGEQQIAALLRRNPDIQREPVEAGEIGGLRECLTPEGDVRTLPSHLPDADPRRAGLDGFFMARLKRAAPRSRGART